MWLVVLMAAQGVEGGLGDRVGTGFSGRGSLGVALSAGSGVLMLTASGQSHYCDGRGNDAI